MNGIRHGKGKEYDEYGNLLFDGEYINGKKEKEKIIINWIWISLWRNLNI